MKNRFIPKKFQVTLIAMLVFLLYLVALLYPDTWWGLHYPAFLSSGKGWVLVFLTIAFTLFFQKYSFWEGLQEEKQINYSWIWILGLSTIAAILFYNLPIYADSYGDALEVLTDREMIVVDFNDAHKNKLFDFDITNLKIGTGTTFALVAWISYVREIPVYDAFRILGGVCGFGFVFFMLSSAFRIAKNNQQRILFALIVLGTPITQVFCGHIEIYAPVYFLLALFWYVLLRFLEKPSILLGAIMIVLCLLNLKFHITGVLTVLITLIAIAIAFRKSRGLVTTWKQLGMYVLGPAIGIGLLVYIFVTKSIFATRKFSDDNLVDAIFLPVRSVDPAPYDRYNLFSWNHFFDYFNLVFLWSALSIIVVVISLVFMRKRIRWNASLVQVSGMALICYVLLFFVLNPLLSMPNDWDLMSIPAIVLIIFAMSIVAETKSHEKEERSFSSYLIGPGVGLLLIGWSGHLVNASQDSLSERLFSMGKYTFKTYWIGASTPIVESLKLMDDDEQKKRALEEAVIELDAYHVQGKDTEYAALVFSLGEEYRKSKQIEKAFEMYKKAYRADPMFTDNAPILYQLLEYKFVNKQYQDALEIADMLVRIGYPNKRKALRVAIHTALEAGAYDKAKKYCQQLLQIDSSDRFIQEILELLNNAEDKSLIKLKFRQS